MEGLNLKTGDLVIGTRDPSKSVYSPEGKKLIEGGIALVGTEEDIADLQTTIKNTAKQTGGQIVEEKKKKKKVKNNKAAKYARVEQVVPESFDRALEDIDNDRTVLLNRALNEEPTIKPIQVYFENAFGKIRSTVEQIIEHELAFMLVFSSEEEIVFEPKISETLNFTYNKVKYSVYYPGVIFDWTDGIKKAMILFKAPQENE